jgi:hypothetical protein
MDVSTKLDVREPSTIGRETAMQQTLESQLEANLDLALKRQGVAG